MSEAVCTRCGAAWGGTARCHCDACHRTFSGVSYFDRAHIARELADVVYVAYGTAHAFNIDLDAALAEIHRASMSKLVGPGLPLVRDDGKILKPPGFVAPDMTTALPAHDGEDGVRHG